MMGRSCVYEDDRSVSWPGAKRPSGQAAKRPSGQAAKRPSGQAPWRQWYTQRSATARSPERSSSLNTQVAIQGGTGLDSAEIAKVIADIAVDKKATDVVVLDIREQSVIADYFVICTGSNPRQIQAVASAVEDKLSELNVATRGFEGSAQNGWMLLDCGDVIAHIFGPMEREFYRLERLWSAAPTVVYLQ